METVRIPLGKPFSGDDVVKLLARVQSLPHGKNARISQEHPRGAPAGTLVVTAPELDMPHLVKEIHALLGR